MKKPQTPMDQNSTKLLSNMPWKKEATLSRAASIKDAAAESFKLGQADRPPAPSLEIGRWCFYVN